MAQAVETPGVAGARTFATGELIAGVWTVERVLPALREHSAALALSVQSAGRAVLFLVPPGAPDPSLDPALAAHWGTSRRILRDEHFGRIVVDEIPDGALLSDRFAAGAPPSAGLINELGRRIREAHEHERAHGALSAEWIALGAGELAVAGWGLAAGDLAERRAADLSFLKTLSAAGQRAPVAAHPTAPAAPSAIALRAAIASNNLITLRRAVQQLAQDTGALDDPETQRAHEALTQLQLRVAELHADAQRLLTGGDPLGAVAVCREAIRLGAEQETEPLLRQARRQARAMLSQRRLTRPQIAGLVAGGVLLVALLVFGIRALLHENPAAAQLRQQVEASASNRPQRDVVRMLFGLRGRGEQRALVERLLAERLKLVGADERQRLVAKRTAAVARGAQPLEADQLAEHAIGELERLAASGADQPSVETRFQRALAEIDRAAALYRAAVELSVEEAVRGIDGILAQDPAFAGP